MRKIFSYVNAIVVTDYRLKCCILKEMVKNKISGSESFKIFSNIMF